MDKLGLESNRKKVISIENVIRMATGGHDSNGEGGEGDGVRDGGRSTGGGAATRIAPLSPASS